jgi:hypothetical protein
MHNYAPDLPCNSVSTDYGMTGSKFAAFPYNFNARYAQYSASLGWSWPSRSLEWATPGNTWKRVSIAGSHTSPQTLAAVWLSGETATNDQQAIRWALSSDGGATWQRGYLSDNGQQHATSRKSVFVTWDPNSSRFVISWLTNTNNLAFQTISTSGQMSSTVYYITTAIDAPAVACTNFLTSENCFVVYAGNDSGPWLRYTYGDVNYLGEFHLSGSSYGTGYAVFRTPSVAAIPNDIYYPFVLAFKRGGVGHVYRKPFAQSASLVFHGNIVGSPNISAPSLGFYNGGGSDYYSWVSYLVSYD